MTYTIGFDIFAIDGASRVFERVSARASGMATTAEKASKVADRAILGLGATALLLGVKATAMAADFDAAVLRLQTTAGESPRALTMVSDGLLAMAGKVGYTAKQLATGMYTVESAGYHGAAALQVLEAAAKGARIEGADLSTVTDAVSSLLVDYHLKASDAAKVTNVLVAATGHGKTTFEGMAAALPNVAAAAASAKISISETAAAIATMTMHGTDAAKAGTYLRQVIGQLEAPTAKARKVMGGLGIDANKLGLTLSSGSGHGLADAIGMVDNAITRHLTPSGLVSIQTFAKSKGSVADYQKMLLNLPPAYITTFGALSQMVGGVKSLQGFLQLGGENLKTYRANVAAVNAQVKAGGKDVEGFAAQQATLTGKWNDAKGAASALMIELGHELEPAAKSVMDIFIQSIGWMSKHQQVVLAVGSAVLVAAGTLTVLKLAMAATNLVMDANPFVLVTSLLIGLTAGIIYAYNHSATFRRIVTQTWADVKDGAIGMKDLVVQDLLFMADVFLTIAGQIVHGAAFAFGWVPGIGPKLKGAARAFDTFQAEVNAALAGINNRNVTVSAQLALTNGNNKRDAFLARATGGPIPLLPGADPNHDSVHVLAMPGEFVVRKDGSNMRDALRHFGYLAMAAGGVVPNVHLPSGSAVNSAVNSNFASFANTSVVPALHQLLLSAGGAGGGGAARWAGVVLQVLALLHQPSTLLGAVLRRIGLESGGNPSAINLWDSNARAGHPSQGLMQTIPGTFATYAGPFRGLGIDNPLANIYAGLNYALHTYGSIGAIDPLIRPYGYDSGGVLKPGYTLAYNGTGHDEYVTNPAKTPRTPEVLVIKLVTPTGRLIREELIDLRRSLGGQNLGFDS